MKTLEAIVTELEAPIPRSAVRTRDEAGLTLSYVDGHYVVARLNAVLGHDRWSYSLEELAVVATSNDERGGKAYTNVSYRAQVTLLWQPPHNEGYTNVSLGRTDVGFGHGRSTNAGKAHESAGKEAVTDALKRAARTLGNSMGLALYEKEQTGVSDDAPAATKKGRAKKAEASAEASATPFTPAEVEAIQRIIKEAKKEVDLEDARAMLNQNKTATNRPALVELFLAKKTALQKETAK